jgi:hypothetical protein
MRNVGKTILKPVSAVICAFFVEVVATGSTPEDLIARKNLLIAILPVLVVALVVYELLERYSSALDKRFDWLDHTGERALYQMAGLVVLFLLMLMFITLEFSLREGLVIYTKIWFIHVTAVIWAYLTLVTLTGLSLHFYNRLLEMEEIIRKQFPYFLKL